MKKVVLIAMVMTVVLSHQPNLVSQARVTNEAKPLDEPILKDSLNLIIRELDSLKSVNEDMLIQLQDQQLVLLID